MLLVTQKLQRSDMSRAAEVTFCLSTADSTLATYQDAIDDFQANFNANFAGGLDAAVAIPPPEGRGGDGSDVPILVFASGAAAVGASTNQEVPPNVAILVRKRTAAGGRSNRGRTYYPFMLSTANCSENGTVDPTFKAALQTVMTAFLAQLTTDSTPMVIENKTFNQPAPPHFVTLIHKNPFPVVSYQVETLVATQRRRLGR